MDAATRERKIKHNSHTQEDRMNTQEIQARLDDLAKAMTAKGLSRPDPGFIMSANVLPRAHVDWGSLSDRNYKSFAAKTIELSFDAADAFIAAMPTPEEAKRNEFTKALAKAIELGKAAHIEVEVLNPLLATMKRLSENALTSQVAA